MTSSTVPHDLSEMIFTNTIKVWDVWSVEAILILLLITRMIFTMIHEFCVQPHKLSMTSNVFVITVIYRKDKSRSKPSKPIKGFPLQTSPNLPSLALTSFKVIKPLILLMSMLWLVHIGMTPLPLWHTSKPLSHHQSLKSRHLRPAFHPQTSPTLIRPTKSLRIHRSYRALLCFPVGEKTRGWSFLHYRDPKSIRRSVLNSTNNGYHRTRSEGIPYS